VFAAAVVLIALASIMLVWQTSQPPTQTIDAYIAVLSPGYIIPPPEDSDMARLNPELRFIVWCIKIKNTGNVAIDVSVDDLTIMGPTTAALTTRTITIDGTCTYDVDENIVSPPRSDRDLWWEVISGPPYDRELEPENGTEFANLGIVDFDSVCNASNYSYSTDPIPDENLPQGR